MRKNIVKKMKRTIKVILANIGIWEPVSSIIRGPRISYLIKDGYKKGLGFYMQFVKPGDLVFDVGANYGNRVSIFLDLGCKVVAIEPQGKCTSFLQKNFKDHKDQIQIEKIGLGSKEEERILYISDNSVLSSFSKEYIEKVKDSRHKTSIWHKTEKVQISTLDNLIKKYGTPKFCKIDVEGFELEVLNGLSSPITFISFEYNVPEFTQNLLACLERISSIGDFEYSYSIGESMELNSNWIDFYNFRKTINSKIFQNSRFGDIYAKLT